MASLGFGFVIAEPLASLVRRRGCALSRTSWKRRLQSERCNQTGLRLFSVTCSLSGMGPPPRKEKKRIEIPGLEPITYADRMHFVPGLAKPQMPKWERGWHDPFHALGVKHEEMALYKEKPCYMFHQRTKILEGEKQALWLTKSKLIEGLPEQVIHLAEDPLNQIENQDDQVQKAISHARFWVTTQTEPTRDRFCTESDIFQVRGINGLLLNSMNPLIAVASKEEVQATETHVLETFSPISPKIDLQVTNVYEERNDTGFREGYPYPHAHTLYITDSYDANSKFKPEHLRAKMMMFAFGNALVRAKLLYGEQPKVLENPVVVQCVATDGRTFQFMVLQLNTTDLDSSEGIKNLIWMDQDQLLYDTAVCVPIIKKKVVQVPAGFSGYQPETFKKFLALYLHGAV
nr:PREDICTED: 39S ribosomal protein L37, mitochondrial [Latimeria chalumnae]|eukprot:XP_014347852.1 PREDICTED: 39S ribosomal protein L37, mitochondrial [Latimeria chalumnae]